MEKYCVVVGDYHKYTDNANEAITWYIEEVFALFIKGKKGPEPEILCRPIDSERWVDYYNERMKENVNKRI